MPGLHMAAYAPPGSMTWTVPQYPVAMSTQSMLNPGLKFYIKRGNGSLVPLVPADELPDDIRLIGVPLSLSALQAENMLFVGHDSSARRKYSHVGSLTIKESIAPVPVAMKYTPEVVSDNNHVSQLSQAQFLATPTTTFIPPPKPLTQPELKPKPLYNERPPPPSGIEPDQRKKVYCNYWCLTGKCGFAQQGCMYKHEMPEDLSLIGLDRVPAWYRKEQARKKAKAKRTERNVSSSEWEVVEQQQIDNSALHSDDPVRIRVPPSRPAGITTTKRAAQESRPALFLQKDAAAASDIASDAATAGSSAPDPSSPPGGVKLGAAKTPVRGPPSLPLRKQTLESPIEDGEEEDLIDFDVLIPSSSPDLLSPAEPSPEARVNDPPKEEEVSRRPKIVAKGGVAFSLGRGARSSIGGRGRRGSADKKTGATSPPRQRKITVKGKVKQGNGESRGDGVKMVPVAGVTAKATDQV